jgi:hypothetical protein
MLKALSRRHGLVLAGLVVACLTPAAHASFVITDDTSFSYTGTVTDPTGVVTQIPNYVFNGTTYTGRDASLWVTSNAPTSIVGAGWENTMVLNTAWYATLAPASGYGWGNPNNTNTGFFQLYDEDSSSVTTVSGSWDSTKTVFTLSVTGSGASAEDYARLWDAPHTGGPASDTAGTFSSYSMSLVATFANPATEEFPGWWSTYETPVSITGSMTGTFQNESPNTALNGPYTYDLTFQGQNWASEQGASFTGSTYYAAGAVPEPATWLMLIVGFGMIGCAMRARREGLAAAA